MTKQRKDIGRSSDNSRQIDALSNGWRHLAEKASPFYGGYPTICMLVLPSFDGQTSAETSARKLSRKMQACSRAIARTATV